MNQEKRDPLSPAKQTLADLQPKIANFISLAGGLQLDIPQDAARAQGLLRNAQAHLAQAQDCLSVLMMELEGKL